MIGGLGKAAAPCPQRGKEGENNNARTLLRHTTGTDGARSEHGALARRDYGLLAPTGLAVDPAVVRYQVSRDGYETTRSVVDQARRETEAGD